MFTSGLFGNSPAIATVVAVNPAKRQKGEGGSTAPRARRKLKVFVCAVNAPHTTDLRFCGALSRWRALSVWLFLPPSQSRSTFRELVARGARFCMRGRSYPSPRTEGVSPIRPGILVQLISTSDPLV